MKKLNFTEIQKFSQERNTKQKIKKLLYNLSDGSNISQPAYARYLALTVGILF